VTAEFTRAFEDWCAWMRAEWSAEEYRRALLHVRTMLAHGRTVGHDREASALAAENFIIDLLGLDKSEVIP